MGSDLKGKIVILDFFTYCCMNCVHILPHLERLEQKHSVPDGLAIVGVHSAKFANEKLLASILSAVLRYNITHPVVNDSEAIMWNRNQIQCWPTLLILGPESQALLCMVGEGHISLLDEFVEVALTYYKSSITSHGISLDLVKNGLPSSPLLFPGKVCIEEGGGRIAISDTGHNRVVIVNNMGLVQDIVGSGEANLKNGSFSEVAFRSPQGVVWLGESLYVADTGNHCIRQISLTTNTVSTVAGSGRQSTDVTGGQVGVSQELCSPWGLVLGQSAGSKTTDVLYIAMAGSHQIWALFLEDCNWLKNREYKKHTCIAFAGSGNEENRNNSYPHKAGFAQPSGLAIDPNKRIIYVADSESSSLRTVSLVDGAVKAVVGGDRDPTNLFAYGDVDGKGGEVRLQHPLDVAVFNTESGEVLVADSYNHKLKLVNSSSKSCTTYLGVGTAGDQTAGSLLESQLNEPGGLAVDHKNKLVYVADTNNHGIKVINTEDMTVRKFPIIMSAIKTDRVDTSPSKKKSSSFERLTAKSADVVNFDPWEVNAGNSLTFGVKVQLPLETELTEGAPSAWQLFPGNGELDGMTRTSSTTEGRLMPDSIDSPLCFKYSLLPEMDGKKSEIQVELLLYYCDNAGACRMKGLVLRQPVCVGPPDNRNSEVAKTIIYSVKP